MNDNGGLIVLVIVAGIGLCITGGLGSWVATEKKRDGGEGFLLGLFFGPFGVLIEALMPTLPGPAPVAPAPAPCWCRQRKRLAQRVGPKRRKKNVRGRASGREKKRRSVGVEILRRRRDGRRGIASAESNPAPSRGSRCGRTGCR
jgi:hypothetical protein